MSRRVTLAREAVRAIYLSTESSADTAGRYEIDQTVVNRIWRREIRIKDTYDLPTRPGQHQSPRLGKSVVLGWGSKQ